MCKKAHFRTPFDSQYVKGCQTLLTSVRQHFHYISSLLSGKLSWKISLLMISEILGLIVNTLTVYAKYFPLSRKNVTQPIPMYLSNKPKIFFEVFVPLLKFI